MKSVPISPIQQASLVTLAKQFGWRLVILFGSLARDGDGRDVDFAVLPSTEADLLEQGRWQTRLEELFAPRPVDLLLLQDALSPLTRFEIFRDGLRLYEGDPGLFTREQDRAFFLYADSEKFRRASREMLRG